MTSSARVLQRYKAAGDDPPGKILSVVRRALPGRPEYQSRPSTDAPHQFVCKADMTHFALEPAGMQAMIRAGLLWIRIIDHGFITLGFAGGDEAPSVDFFLMGQKAFARGATRTPGLNRELMNALKGVSDVRGAMTEWTRGWDQANLAAPV